MHFPSAHFVAFKLESILFEHFPAGGTYHFDEIKYLEKGTRREKTERKRRGRVGEDGGTDYHDAIQLVHGH